MDKPILTFGSLFSGIGGLDLGLERAGMQCAWQVEIDDYGIQVLIKQWPNIPKHRDVRSIGRHRGDIHTCYIPVTDVDALVGGFPCQPQSLAGKRKASKDARNLWPEFYRLICELEPRWIVAENVLGLLSSEDGAFFGGVLRNLAEAGYDARWQVLSAAQFGAPHRRERVFLVAYSNRNRQRIRQNQQEHQSASVGTSDACADGPQGVMAHTSQSRGWLRERSDWQARAQADRGSELAHTSSTGWQEWGAATIAGEQGHAPWRNLAPGSPVEDSTGRRERQYQITGRSQGTQSLSEQSSSRTTQSLLGRIFNGISRKLDGYRWPAGPGHHQFTWEAPRVITWKMPWRAARLKGLGNAVVPAVAEAVGRDIMAAEAERQVVA